MFANGPSRDSIFASSDPFFESLPFPSEPGHFGRFPAITVKEKKEERMEMNTGINDETGYALRRWVRGTNLYHLLQQLL